jgi:FkbM family methyltransferase
MSLKENASCSYDVSEIACGNYNGESNFFVPRRWSGMASFFESFSKMDDLEKMVVSVRRFDEAFDWQNYPGNIFLKLDIEGGEYAFLQGAREMLKVRQPKILLEINPDSLRAAEISWDSMIALLREIGYRYFFELEDLKKGQPLEKLNSDHYRNIILSTDIA